MSQNNVLQVEYTKAAEHLGRNDPLLAPVIVRHGLCTTVPHTNYYYELVRSIIGQQLSVRAAAAIKKRFVGLYDGEFPTPRQIVATEVEVLRSVGLSRPKALYVQDLARHVLDGRLRIDDLTTLDNEEVIKELTAVKGIGEWTAHMFLIFALGRLDVLPIGDLGVRMGVKHLYGFDTVPSPAQVTEVAVNNNWHPYESIAAWYLWRSLDNAPQ